MRRILVTVGVIVFSLGLIRDARPQHDDHGALPRLEWKEFKALYDAGKVIVIDVRDPEAYAAGHIPGARSMPVKTLEQTSAGLSNTSMALALYCACTGDESSGRGTKILRSKGLKAYVLVGGYRRWVRETRGNVATGAPTAP